MRRACLLAAALVAACSSPHSPVTPEVAEATQFLDDADAQLRKVGVAASQAEWDYETDITPAHGSATAAAAAALNDAYARLIKRARRYEGMAQQLDAQHARMLHVLIYGGGAQPAPDDPQQSAELASVAAEMTGVYAKGKACDGSGSHCQDLDQLSLVLQKSRQPAELLAAWQGWHAAVGRAERPLFTRYVPLANAGARATGFTDVAQMWQAGYDMPPEAFAAETDRLWTQMKPLYTQLHCYTRRKLNELYGDAVVGKTGPIPAHLLGNMWAQSWGYLYPELEPYKGVAPIDATPALQAYDAAGMIKLGEGFYTSLGMDPLPATFWQRSMLAKPPGKDVMCHPEAFDVGYDNDLRVKLCVKKTSEDLVTIHHELGHDYYYHSYYRLPFLLQNGANDGFHEAIGDTIALSMTPAYLKKRGLLTTVVTNEQATINQQMAVALGKIAFLPFAIMVDRWRWDAYSGAIAPDRYNAHWWELREKYQGVSAPLPRSEADFDPGAKYHVAANVSYMRYFLAAVLQFQFQRALCKTAGFTGPLHECSIYENKAAGEAYKKLLALGASVPWQDALYQLTGEREMDASALLEYFAPLQGWLEQQNAGQTCGW